MKLIIFGATGRVGKQLVKQSIEDGHNVTAFVRDRSGLEIENTRLNTIEGDVFDRDSVTKAIRGHDAVLCVLGDGRKGKVRAAGTKNIVAAMEQTGVKRLICQSTVGAGDSVGNLNFFWKRIMFGMLLKRALADHEEQEKIIRNSKLDWTIVRPAAFTEGPKTKTYKYGFSPNERDITLKISLADVAHFLLRQLQDKSNLGKTPGLSY